MYLIEILHQTTTIVVKSELLSPLYLIEILHQTTTGSWPISAVRCCILSKFYIKPQPRAAWPRKRRGCILSKFYIKPQQILKIVSRNRGCILSKFYIKPQHADTLLAYWDVVSYRNSTSNHNNVLYNTIRSALYLIEILHQTTTVR